VQSKYDHKFELVALDNCLVSPYILTPNLKPEPQIRTSNPKSESQPLNATPNPKSEPHTSSQNPYTPEQSARTVSFFPCFNPLFSIRNPNPEALNTKIENTWRLSHHKLLAYVGPKIHARNSQYYPTPSSPAPCTLHPQNLAPQNRLRRCPTRSCWPTLASSTPSKSRGYPPSASLVLSMQVREGL